MVTAFKPTEFFPHFMHVMSEFILKIGMDESAYGLSCMAVNQLDRMKVYYLTLFF